MNRATEGKDSIFTSEVYDDVFCTGSIEAFDKDKEAFICPYDPPEDKSLTLTHLNDAFVYLMIGQGLAVIIFLIEMVAGWWQRKK